MKEFDTLAELQGSTQSKTGLRLKCRENLYEYIVQASGYTATGDDVTFSNGRVAKCVFVADAKYIKTTAGNVQDALDSIVSGGLPSQSGNEFKFLTTNGTSASWFQGTLQMDTFANLQTFSPTVDGTTFICQERANARYILQTSGYVALPGDVTFANGRVGALQAVNGKFLSNHFGVIGSGDDTQIVSEWLSRGDCRGVSGVYLIDKVVVSNDIDVIGDPGFTLKARSQYDNTTQEGLVEINGRRVSWVGGLFDGNKISISGNITSIDVNKRKSLLQLSNCTLGEIRLSAVNHFGFCFLFDTCSGGMVDLYARDSAYLAYLDRLEDCAIGDLVAYDMDNTVGGDLDAFQNVNAHVVHVIRCLNSPINRVFLYNIGSRSGRLYSGSTVFYNGFTQSSCRRCPVSNVSVLSVVITEDSATDLPLGCAASTSILPISLVSNQECDISNPYVTGQATQGIEVAGCGDLIISNPTLRNNGGRQGVVSGSSGIEVHGSARYLDNVASSKALTMGTVQVNGGVITGYHNGVDIRKGNVALNNVDIHGNRKHGVVLDTNGISEWSTSDSLRPSVTINNCDIQYNGFCGVYIVTAREVKVNGGTIANNAQRAGFTDPTTNAASGYNNIRYDTSGGVVDLVSIVDVSYAGNNSESISDGISYLPYMPSNFSITPDSRVKFIPVSLAEPNKIKQGARVTVTGATVAGGITGWLKYGDLDKWLIEVDSSRDTEVWIEGSNISPLTGTLSLSDDDITGSGTAFESEVLKPSFIKVGGNYGQVLTVFNNTSAYVNDTSDVYDGLAVFPSDFAGQSAEIVSADVTLFESAVENEAGLKSTSVLSLRRGYGVRDSNSVPSGDVYTEDALSISDGAGTEIVDTSTIGVGVGSNRVFRVVASRATGDGFVVALFGEAAGNLYEISVSQTGPISLTFSPSGTSLVAIGSSTRNWDINIQQIGNAGVSA